jgi:P-type Ca2+ transporter type 2C
VTLHRPESNPSVIPSYVTDPLHWHTLSPATVLVRLASGPQGLTEQEAALRLARHGPNAFRVASPVSAWVVLLRQFRSVMILLLLVAAIIAFFLGDPLDAGAIMAVLAINVVIGFATELRAHRAVESLLALEVTRARVVRDGKVREVDAGGLVPGDLIEVEAGGAIPADARLLESVELRTVEASLTGESAPTDKGADAQLAPDVPIAERVTMLYKATTVVAGRGRAVVVATGMATEVGRIGELVSGIVEERTPLELRLDALSRRLVAVALGVAGLVTWIGIRQGLPIGELLQTALALAVAAVPEGLPIVGTIAMAVGVRRMARRKALIRHLPVVETLGSTTVICTDKTGTLTAGEMTANVMRFYDRELVVSGIGYTPEGEFLAEGARIDPLIDVQLGAALRICALAGRGDVTVNQGLWTAVGDPTEVALAVLARKAGLSRSSLSREWPEIGEVPFTSHRMFMATFHRAPTGITAYVKGAPRRIIQLSTRILTAQGLRDIGEAERERLLDLNRELAGRGLRVLALGLKEVGTVAESELHGLTLVGFVGMTDPPAPGVKDTIAAFHAAGIRVVMLTGDQRLTAERVAQDLGLLGEGGAVMDGTEVDHLSDDGLQAAVAGAAGYSRVSPEAKLRIVVAYQATGEVVAMFGDGVNDAAALRQADIGVAMGARGTDMAKEAADLILEDDRFPTIAAAIEQGRVVFDNIRKFVFYLFSCNLAEIMVLLGAGLAGLPAPLLPLQILWLNLLTDTVPALALAVEPAESRIMRQPPRDPEEAILSGRVARSTIGYAVLISLATLSAFVWGLGRAPENSGYAATLAFMTLAFAQIFHLGNARSGLPVISPARMVSNPYALAAVGLTAGLQVLAVELQPLAAVLQVHPLGKQDWLLIGGLALIPALVGQTIKVAVAVLGKSSPEKRP